MDKLFLDTNVVIDFLCERERFYLPAAKIIVKGYNKEVELCCSSLTFATASYLMEKGNVSVAEIFHKLADFLTVCEPSPVDRQTIQEALSSDFADFEDALQYFSAKRFGADFIITRNEKDFGLSELAVLNPTDYLLNNN